jgi:hypothetical protein
VEFVWTLLWYMWYFCCDKALRKAEKPRFRNVKNYYGARGIDDEAGGVKGLPLQEPTRDM